MIKTKDFKILTVLLVLGSILLYKSAPVLLNDSLLGYMLLMGIGIFIVQMVINPIRSQAYIGLLYPFAILAISLPLGTMTNTINILFNLTNLNTVFHKIINVNVFDILSESRVTLIIVPVVFILVTQVSYCLCSITMAKEYDNRISKKYPICYKEDVANCSNADDAKNEFNKIIKGLRYSFIGLTIMSIPVIAVYITWAKGVANPWYLPYTLVVIGGVTPYFMYVVTKKSLFKDNAIRMEVLQEESDNIINEEEKVQEDEKR